VSAFARDKPRREPAVLERRESVPEQRKPRELEMTNYADEPDRQRQERRTNRAV